MTSRIAWVLLLLPSLVFAGEPCRDLRARLAELERQVAELHATLARMEGPAECADPLIDLRKVPVGFRCRTSKGAIFERVARGGFGEAWRDPDGKIWSDEVSESSSQPESAKLCKKRGGTLPSRKDFERAHALGFRQVLPHSDGWYWTSTTFALSGYHKTFYQLLRGDMFYFDYDSPGDFHSARCVAP